MGKKSKRYEQISALVDREKVYELGEAVSLVKKTAIAKFDQTIDLSVKLNIEMKKSEQTIRGTVLLPHGTGKKRAVAVVCKGEKLSEAKNAGADFVGSEDLIEDILKGRVKFDVLVATPDIMRELAKLGKILGPRGLMPSPKAGTVTFEIADAIKRIRAGEVEYRADKDGVVHMGVGKGSFEEEKLKQNIESSIEAILKARPSSVKGQYMKSISISATMGPGIKIAVPYS